MVDEDTNDDLDEVTPDTPRVCAACRGEHKSCSWCGGTGYQTPEQQFQWARFSLDLKRLSTTSVLLEDVWLGIIDKLEKMRTKDSATLMVQGVKLIDEWERTSVTDRHDIAERLKEWSRRALALWPPSKK